MVAHGAELVVEVEDGLKENQVPGRGLAVDADEEPAHVPLPRMPRPGDHRGNQKLNWLMFDLSKTVGGPSTTDGPVPAAGASTV